MFIIVTHFVHAGPLLPNFILYPTPQQIQIPKKQITHRLTFNLSYF